MFRRRKNLDERVSIISIGRLSAGIAGMIASVLAAPVIAALGWTGATITLMVIALITMVPIRFFAKERVVYDRKEKVTLKSMMQAVYRNKYLMIFYSAFIIILSLNTGSIAGTYFATYNLGNFEMFSIIMMTSFLPMLFIPILIPPLVRRFGKKKIFLYATGFGIIISLVQYLAGYENLTVFLILNFIKGFSIFMPMTMMGLFSADCAEYGAYVTGKRNEGVTFSIQTFSTKLGSAFSGLLGSVLLGYYGYVANVEQTARAIDGIWKMMTIIPIIGLILGFIIIAAFYNLKESDVERMIKEMQNKKIKKAINM